MATSASSNPLSSASLATYIASSLPRDASPQLRSPTDAIAIACHAGMLAVGFRLVGLGEDHRIDAQSDARTPQPLPNEWNASNSSHAFRYRHSQSAMEYLLKVNRLGNKTVIYGIGMGDDRTTSFDLATSDFISESSLPCTPIQSSASPEDTTHEVQKVFISPSRLTDLGNLLRINIIQKLMPGLQKEGYEDQSTNTTAAAREDERDRQRSFREDQQPRHDPLRDDPVLPQPARPHPLADPSIGNPLRQPQRPIPDFAPPGFEDEHEILRPPQGAGIGGPGYLGAYGDRDLYPQGLGPNDPMRWGGVGPGLGGGLGGRGGGGGMFPTEDDFMGGGGGGAGFDPQAPPGARFDPLGPGMRRGGGGGGPFGPGGMGGMGGRPPNPFGGFGGGDFI